MSPNSQDKDSTDRYLEYLDKEMSIMGILSTFCLAVPALVLYRLATATTHELQEVWDLGERFFWTGSVLLLTSAALYYKQRSLLAYYYGRIALADVADGVGVTQWKICADSWTTWIPYHVAHWVAVAGVLEYALGFVAKKYGEVASCIAWWIGPVAGAAIICVAFVFVGKDRAIRWYENPWLCRLHELLQRVFGKSR